MNKTAIKNFAIEARKKLINEITYRTGLVGITKNGIAEPIHKAEGIEMYDIGASDPYTIKGEQLKQRKSLASRVKEKGFDNVIEEVAYTWFNRIVAIRFMEVNDYLPTRVRVLSSETAGKIEPDIVTEAPNIDLGFTSFEIDEILQFKHDNKLDELFRMLFIKQCNALNAILPELFEKTSDYTELLLSISFTNEDGIVRMLVDGIEEEDFKDQVEIIGWMYQYYNTELKDETFALLKKNVKITKERIPAATQLFTPDWIVRYMVENSLGRLWMEHLQVSEDKVLDFNSIDFNDFTFNTLTNQQKIEEIKSNWKYYLEEAEQEPDVKAQLQKLREERKNLKPEEIKVIDPCMGSGHILVYAFDVLMDIYRSYGYEEREAVKLILKNNLYGLDIDDRAYQFAYFAVMMKARGYSRRILNEGITPNLCAIQESNSINVQLIMDNGQLEGLIDYFTQGLTEIEKVKLKADFEYLIEVFQDAKEYGSILDVKQINFDVIERRIKEITIEGVTDLFAMQYRSLIIEKFAPLVKQAKIMAQKYDVIVTNPPYMGLRNMGNYLAKYVNSNYTDSKTDLFACFIEKCSHMAKMNAYQAMITQHNFMFLTSFEKLREKILEKDIINMIHLGSRAFEEISGEVVQTTAFVLKNSNLSQYIATYVRLVDYDSQYEKEKAFLNRNRLFNTNKKNFLNILGNPISYWISNYSIYTKEKLSNSFFSGGRNKTHNNEKFVRQWWEINRGGKWKSYSNGGNFRKWYGNYNDVVDWSPTAKMFYKIHGGLLCEDYWGKEGITWNGITGNSTCFRIKTADSEFSSVSPTIFNKEFKCEYKVLGFLNSKVCDELLKVSNPTLNTLVGDVLELPNLTNQASENVISIVQQNISISKTDWNNFETSWDYKKHPFIAYRTLSGWGDDKTKYSGRIKQSYKNWEMFTERQFAQLKSNEEELNRIFIEIYGLQDELTPEVDDKDVTIRKADLERDIKSFISYAVGCMFGRYSLDVEGLAYAGGEWDSSKYKTFIPDADNIIPITDEEYFNGDIVGRFVEFVKVTFGADTLEENLDFIANALGNKGNTSREVIRQYFLKDFYKDHVRTYQKKPIYWMFDSGKENGFKALIYMHRYNQDTVARVRTDYLHKTQKAIESAIIRADMVIESTANPSQKAKAVKEKEKLVKQLAETRVYDAAIAHVAAQRIAIDLDDGVTVNYAKFQGVEVSSEGKKASKIDLLARI